MDKAFALSLSKSIIKYAKQFGTDPMFSVAIAMQESAFVNKNRMGSIVVNGRIVHGATDVGVFQIHVATIAYLGINVARLVKDVDYQTFWHTKILAQKIKTCKAQAARLKVESGDEWSCYHSFTYEKREIYLEDVGAHLSKIAHL